MRNIIVSLFIGLVAGGAMVYNFIPQIKTVTNTVELEKVVIEEKEKKTTIYRARKDKTKEVKIDPRRWQMRLLAAPQELNNYEIGLGYQLLPNVSLEASYGPNNGKVLLGFGIRF